MHSPLARKHVHTCTCAHTHRCIISKLSGARSKTESLRFELQLFALNPEEPILLLSLRAVTVPMDTECHHDLAWSGINKVGLGAGEGTQWVICLPPSLITRVSSWDPHGSRSEASLKAYRSPYLAGFGVHIPKPEELKDGLHVILGLQGG